MDPTILNRIDALDELKEHQAETTVEVKTSSGGWTS